MFVAKKSPSIGVNLYKIYKLSRNFTQRQRKSLSRSIALIVNSIFRIVCLKKHIFKVPNISFIRILSENLSFLSPVSAAESVLVIFKWRISQMLLSSLIQFSWKITYFSHTLLYNANTSIRFPLFFYCLYFKTTGTTKIRA